MEDDTWGVILFVSIVIAVLLYELMRVFVLKRKAENKSCNSDIVKVIIEDDSQKGEVVRLSVHGTDGEVRSFAFPRHSDSALISLVERLCPGFSLTDDCKDDVYRIYTMEDANDS